MTNLKDLTGTERTELATEVNAIVAQRNEVKYFNTRKAAEAGLKAIQGWEAEHGRPSTQLSLGKVGRYHVVFIQRVEIA